jgi:type I restriction enzyme S subunit
MAMTAWPTGWNTRNTAELLEAGVLEIGDGYRAKNSELGTSGLPFLRVSNITDHINVENVDILCESSVIKAGSKVSQSFDVLLTTKGSVGRFAFVNSDTPRFVYSPQLSYWRVLKESVIDPRFLFYWMHGKEYGNQAHKVKGLTDMADYVSLTEQRRMDITLPPLPVQQKISTILSTYDDLIDDNRRRIHLLEEMAKAVYQEWFVHFRFPGHETDQMVDSELGEIPKGWKVRRISEMVSTQYGYTESARKEEVGPKYVRGMDINKTSYITWDTVPYCSIDAKSFEKYQLKDGDILVIRMADPGKVGIVEKEIDAVFASYLIRLKIEQDSLLPYFLFYTLSADRYQGFISGASTGTTRKSASAPLITNFDIVMPSRILINAFEVFAKSARHFLNNLLDQNTVLNRTRDLLLPRLLSGEIDVSNLDVDQYRIETRKTSKYEEQSTIDQWLDDGDEEDVERD